jgi:hypothetical protein
LKEHRIKIKVWRALGAALGGRRGVATGRRACSFSFFVLLNPCLRPLQRQQTTHNNQPQPQTKIKAADFKPIATAVLADFKAWIEAGAGGAPGYSLWCGARPPFCSFFAVLAFCCLLLLLLLAVRQPRFGCFFACWLDTLPTQTLNANTPRCAKPKKKQINKTAPKTMKGGASMSTRAARGAAGGRCCARACTTRCWS